MGHGRVQHSLNPNHTSFSRFFHPVSARPVTQTDREEGDDPPPRLQGPRRSRHSDDPNAQRARYLVHLPETFANCCLFAYVLTTLLVFHV